MRVTCEVSTRDRYELLSQCLLSLALQTTKDFDLIIFDDSEEPPRNANALVERYPAYAQVFQLFSEYKIGWEVKFGQKKGQHCKYKTKKTA